MYGMLSHVPLGRDAASLFCGELRPWSERLLAAYRSTPSSAALQFIGLRHAEVSAWRAALAVLPPALREPVLEALDDTPWRDAALPAPRYAEAALLAKLREGIYGGPPPPLVLVHVGALGRHARGLTVEGGRRVAANLLGDPEHTLLQVFHEECHAVTDSAVRTGARSTVLGTPGFAAHAALESSAVRYGAVVIDDVAPELRAAYARWRGAVGAAE